MTNITLRSIELAEAAELAALQSQVFDDYEQSNLLAEVLEAEARARPSASPPELPSRFGVAAFNRTTLVGWSQGYRQGSREFFRSATLPSRIDERSLYQSIPTTSKRSWQMRSFSA
jgi:hypothetical protein